MANVQLRMEIQKALDRVADTALEEDVLDFLKELQHHLSDKVKLTNNLRQILSEDTELLCRLAQ